MSQAKVSEKYQIVIPKEARDAMKVKKGDHLIVETFDGITFLIPKAKKMSRFLKGLFKGTFPKNYLKKERMSWSR